MRKTLKLLFIFVYTINISYAKNSISQPEIIYQKAIKAAQQHDFQAAFKLLQPLAEQGDATAQHNIAVFYQDGLGVKIDLPQALNWYERAGKQGIAEAQFMAGLMHSEGLGTTQNYLQATYWYQQAAEQGHAEAQNNLAARYATGTGVKQNLETAKMWYQRAAEQGNQTSALILQQLNNLNTTTETK